MLAACGDAHAEESARATGTARAEETSDPPPAPRPPTAGSWSDLGHFEDARHRARRVRAWVPVHPDGAHLPVLVVLDGQGASDWLRVDDTIAALSAEQRIEPWIVLAIDSTIDRDRELARTDGQLSRFLRDVVLPAARARLPIREGREHTAILGYSYGGLSAVASVIAEPSTFGRAIAMSPSLWVRERDILGRFEHARQLPVRLWIDVGSREPDDENLIPYMVSDARNLRDLALYRGMIFGRDVGYDEAIGEGHDMRAGGRRMREALLFALSDRDLSRETPSSLSIARYPVRRRRSTFAVRASYEGGERLTFPESLIDVRAGETRLHRDVAPEGLRISARAFGLTATAP